MNDMLYLLDLDRSVFNTDQFVTDVIGVLERNFHIDPHVFRDQLHQTTLGEIGPDFFACAEAATAQSANTISQLLVEALKDTDYTYPDVAPWLRQADQAGGRFMIVTVGRTDFQELKFPFTGPLQVAPKVIVQEDKGKILREILAGEREDILGVNAEPSSTFTIIDDNPRTFEELGDHPRVRQFYLSRPGEKYAGLTVPPHVATITSLGEQL